MELLPGHSLSRDWRCQMAHLTHFFWTTKINSNTKTFIQPDTMNVETSFLLSGIFLSVLCPITVLANSFLLLAIYKDPLKKAFCGPIVCFLLALSIIDLISGLVTEPLVSTYYFFRTEVTPATRFWKSQAYSVQSSPTYLFSSSWRSVCCSTS